MRPYFFSFVLYLYSANFVLIFVNIRVYISIYRSIDRPVGCDRLSIKLWHDGGNLDGFMNLQFCGKVSLETGSFLFHWSKQQQKTSLYKFTKVDEFDSRTHKLKLQGKKQKSLDPSKKNYINEQSFSNLCIITRIIRE